MKSISVVIPLYNKGPHIAAALRSIAEQTLQPLEIIVVDDGSTDGGLEIVRQTPNISVHVRDQPGAGGYAARNVGIMHARGEWIAFLDADDIWKPDHLAELSRAVAGRDQIGCAFAQPELVWGGNRRQPYLWPSRLPHAGEPIDLQQFLEGWLETKVCPMWTGAVAIRRSLLRAERFPEGRALRGGDKDLWLRIMTHTASVSSGKMTAEFHQDAVNRLSRSTAHQALPVLTSTIRRIARLRSEAETKLLRRLNNQEIEHYARYSAGRGSRVGEEFFRSVFLPEGIGTLAKLAVLAGISPVLDLWHRNARRGKWQHRD